MLINRPVSALLGSAVAVIATAGMSYSATPPPEGCPPGHTWQFGRCLPDDDGDDGDREPTGCSQADPTVENIPCAFGDFTFDQPSDRYIRPVTEDEAEWFRPGGRLNRPGALYHGIWEDYPNGWIYRWQKLSGWSNGPAWGDGGYVWMADNPVGPPPVDPEELARQVLDDLDLQPPDIGFAPTPISEDPDSMGLVGAPIWAWVDDPSPQTWGPITGSATERGVTVTVTAEVEEAAWDMGDGHSVTCVDPGTRYDAEMGVRESPTCGHRYTRTSANQPHQAFTVMVATQWTATWESSDGESGTLDVEPQTASAQVRIGERQLIEQGN